MIVSPTEELSSFFFCVLSGLCTGFLFDLFRLFRYRKRRGTVRMAAEDGLFFFLSAILIFWVLYRKTDGAVRLYEWVAAALGAAAYALFLSPLLFRVLLFVTSLFKKILRLSVKALLLPIVLMCKLLKKPVFAVISPVRLWGKKIKSRIRMYSKSKKRSRELSKKIWKKV